MSRFFLLFFCMVFTLHLIAGTDDDLFNSIEGMVTTVNGDTLQQVTVFIPELKIGTYSDDHGKYSLNRLPNGSYTIEFSYIGFKTFIQKINPEKQKSILNVVLKQSPIEADEIVVTAPYATLPSETPYEISSISVDEMQFSGVTTLTEAMTSVPGISQLSSGEGITKPVIRGLHGNRILTVIEGFRFDNQQWQDEHGLGLSGQGLRNVEILKGPASVIYGGDAMSGVLNLVDEKPAPIGSSISDYNIKLDANTLGLNTDVGLKGSTETYYWKVRLGGDTHADYLDGNDERVPNTRFNGLNFKSNFGVIRKNFVSNLNYHFSYYQFGIVEQNEAEKKVDKEEERFGRENERSLSWIRNVPAYLKLFINYF